MQDDLIYEAESVVFAIGNTLASQLKSNLNKKKYDMVARKAAMGFAIGGQKWIDNDLTDAYISGLKRVPKGGTKPIKNGTFLVHKKVDEIPLLPRKIVDKFKDYPNQTKFYEVFRAAAMESLKKPTLQILRTADDVFRQASIEVGSVSFRESDIVTRRLISQRLMNSYADRGLQCITYKNGAKYSIDTYCEMLARTLIQRCSLQASINRYCEKGWNLGVVSAHFRACNLCTPYEGVILSLDGTSDVYPSIWDAEMQGLFHSNCKHDVSPYFEGLTEQVIAPLDPGEAALVNKYGYEEAQKIAYKAMQQQRYIERNIRKYKRESMFSLDEVSQRKADKKVKDWQARQREHLSNNIYLPRKYAREGVNL